MASTYFYQSFGRRVHKTIRRAAKIPYKLGITGEAIKHEEGTYFNRLVGELSEETYNELCADTADVVLETIYYCQSELACVSDALRSSRRALNSNFDELEQKNRLINHDSLILRVKCGPRHPHAGQPPIYITAEKLGSGPENKAGIHIAKFKGNQANIDTRCSLHTIDCGSSRFGSLRNLVETLMHNSPHYDIVHNNCWDYAFKTTKLLLTACIQIADDSGGAQEERDRLQKELNQLEANIVRKHGVNQVKRAANFVKTRVRELLE